MKYQNILYVFVLSLILISCDKDDDDSISNICIDVEYNQEFEIRVSEKVCFPDDFSLVLNEVYHQFCPCNAYCVWAGGLFLSFTETAQNVSIDKEFFPVGLGGNNDTFTNHEIISYSYRYDTEDQIIPPCAEDFDSEKIIITLAIAPI